MISKCANYTSSFLACQEMWKIGRGTSPASRYACGEKNKDGGRGKAGGEGDGGGIEGGEGGRKVGLEGEEGV